jgi:predicted glycosyltransferase
MFYCQHSVGLGHLVRSLTLAEGLAERFDVTFLSGGPIPEQLTAPGASRPDGVRIVQLPPLGHDDSYELVSRDPRYTVEQACELRTRQIGDLFELTRPAALLVELYPFGRKKFAFELRPLLERARVARPAPVVVCSLRDILVGSRRDQQRHDDRAQELTDAYFDAVLVHSDPAFARLEETFHPTTQLHVPVHHTGFVRPPRRTPSSAPSSPVERELGRRPRVIVSAGGGLVGEPLFRAALAGHPVWHARGLSTLLVTGPFLPEPVRAELEQAAAGTPGLEVVDFLPDLAGAIEASAVSVSQVGYNTTMDLLGAGTPAVVVPYNEGKEDEQAERARRLARLGLVQVPDGVLDREPLTGGALAAAVLAALDRPPAAVTLDLDGRERTADLLADLVAARACAGLVPVGDRG